MKSLGACRAHLVQHLPGRSGEQRCGSCCKQYSCNCVHTRQWIISQLWMTSCLSCFLPKAQLAPVQSPIQPPRLQPTHRCQLLEVLLLLLVVQRAAALAARMPKAKISIYHTQAVSLPLPAPQSTAPLLCGRACMRGSRCAASPWLPGLGTRFRPRLHTGHVCAKCDGGVAPRLGKHTQKCLDSNRTVLVKHSSGIRE